MSKFKDQFFALVGKAENILITAHLSPDEDAIASLLAVNYLLSNKYPSKKITPLLSSEELDQYQSFAGYYDIKFVSDLSEYLSDQDLIILLDGSRYSRFTQKPEMLADFPGSTVCIDHHRTQFDDFDLSLVESDAVSTTVLIYQHFFKEEKLEPSIAEILLMGILGDTGNFAYLPPKQAHVLNIAQKLLSSSGSQIQSLQSRYRSIDLPIFHLLKNFIENTAHHQIDDWPPLQTSFLSRSSADGYSPAQVTQASHLYMSHYLRYLTGYPWGAVFTPRPDGSVRVSLRSLPGKVNVREIVERLNLGGGHNLAAAGTIPAPDKEPLSVKKALSDFLDWLKNHQPSSK